MKRPFSVCLGLVFGWAAVACAQQGTDPQDPLLMHRSPVQQPPPKAVPPRTPVKRTAEFVGKPVSVAELEQTLKEVASKPDRDAAHEISQLALTERLSSPKLASLLSTLNGEQARSALTEVADASVFLNLPDSEIFVSAAPDHQEQRRIIAQAIVYLSEMIPKLPNFYATRTTTRYEDAKDDPKHPGSTILTGEPLHRAGTSSNVVLYRNGSETVKPVQAKGRPKYAPEKGLATKGTFGPILSTVMVDASHGETSFSHWEQGANGKEAVFRFVVPKQASHYNVAFRNPPVPSPDQSQEPSSDTPLTRMLNQPGTVTAPPASSSAGGSDNNLAEASGYTADVTIDPATGAILRIALQAALDLDSPMLHADIMVEYGAVEIGGQRYICPLKSVSLSRVHSTILMRDIFENGTALGPEVTRLNDVTFSDYHLFRGDVRIISSDSEPEKK